MRKEMCIRGHFLAETRNARGSCKKCNSERAVAKHKALSAEQRHEIYVKWKQPGNQRRTLRANYGITVEDYNGMLKAQNGVCAICGGVGTDSKKRLAVDHNHKTGAVRALLCNRCNLLLGRVCENPEILESAARYIRGHN